MLTVMHSFSILNDKIKIDIGHRDWKALKLIYLLLGLILLIETQRPLSGISKWKL